MSGSTLGVLFTVTTFGESHGPAIGCVIDGCPPGMELSEADIQPDLDRRKPGTSRHVTQRREDDLVEILSGVYEGKTTGTPIALLIRNEDQRSKDYAKIANTLAASSGARLTITDDASAAVKGVDFIHTDVWVSMGEPKEVWAERIKLLKPYQVDMKLMKATGNPRTKFMHCLPAFHDLETKVGREIHEQFGLSSMEVSSEVFDSEMNIAFEQAENRMHTIKAILVAALAD